MIPSELPWTPEGYGLLLDALSEDRTLLPTTAMPDGGSRVVYLRHDVDAHLANCLTLAEVERQRGATSTWFLRLRGAYNVGHAENVAVLRELARMGHTFGVHYQPPCEVAPDKTAFRVLTGLNAQQIALHEPSRHADPLKDDPRNPHSFPGVTLISDSRRAWYPNAQERLGADRIMLNTHPEHWADWQDYRRLTHVHADEELWLMHGFPR